jgi:integrase
MCSPPACLLTNRPKLLAVKPARAKKRLPHLLTDQELVVFYEAVSQARNPKHLIIIKTLIFTGLRNAELARVRLEDVDLDRWSNLHKGT